MKNCHLKFSFLLLLLLVLGIFLSSLSAEQWKYFFENMFGGFATLLSVSVVIAIYLFQKWDRKMQTAQILLMEIRNAENAINEIKKNIKQRSSEPGYLIRFVLPVNSWINHQHLFVEDFDEDEFKKINEFYNICSVIEKYIQHAKTTWIVTVDEKVKLAQSKILQLADKHQDNRQGYVDEAKKIFDIFFPVDDGFVPNLGVYILETLVPSVPNIMTSSCGAKLKQLAGQ